MVVLENESSFRAAAGLIRTLKITITPSDLLKAGGFVHVTLSPSSDGAALLGMPDGARLTPGGGWAGWAGFGAAGRLLAPGRRG